MQAERKKVLEEALESTHFKKSLRLARNVERLSGAGVVKKIKRLLITPSVYIPYLLMVKSHLYRRASVSARLFWGRRIEIPLQDYDSLALSRFGFAGGTETELKLTRFLIQHLGPTDVFYDIGANYGFFTYLASELGSEIHAFEPIPSIAEVVVKNTKENKKVFVNAVALSDGVGTTNLYLSESSGLSTINASTTDIHTYSYNTSKTLVVSTTTLDEYVKTHSAPTVVKIDVEGAEEAVVEGGMSLLSAQVPTVVMEIWGSNNGGDISMKAVSFLRRAGYNSFSIDETGSVKEVGGDLSVLAPADGVDNFVFKKTQ